MIKPAANLAQLLIEGAQAGEEEGDARWAGIGRGQQPWIEDINGHDRFRPCRGGSQCLIIGQAQIAPDPPDRGVHRSGC